ncbi:hypothetical protein [Aliiglaciecola sp. NS0011-25]|uniref:hypothetical protein n=1 Tax=Aliiglaciecola sp. NS0011-25 TaxID=3127654 RepID=UPI0031099F2F
MTTTVFRLDGRTGRIGSDSRVSFVDRYGNVTKVFDSENYFKIAKIDDVLYGFAGANLMYRLFLSNYKNVINNSDSVLDILVDIAKKNKIEFAMLRFNGELREFAHSPPRNGENEIFLTSNSEVLKTQHYAIGSGKNSKCYKKFRLSKAVQTPILKIIGANRKALNKTTIKEIAKKVGKSKFTADESRKIWNECNRLGGDIFTGGEVRIMENETSNMTAAIAKDQVKILEDLDKTAKSNGVVCASPIYAEMEIQNLNNLGVSAVDPIGINPELKKSKIYEEIAAELKSFL